MGQVRHSSARTTAALRATSQRSQESLQALANALFEQDGHFHPSVWPSLTTSYRAVSKLVGYAKDGGVTAFSDADYKRLSPTIDLFKRS